MTAVAIAERIGCKPRPLAAILGDEQERGRVVRDKAGGYRLVPAAFAPGVVAALRDLRDLA